MVRRYGEILIVNWEAAVEGEFKLIRFSQRGKFGKSFDAILINWTRNEKALNRDDIDKFDAERWVEHLNFDKHRNSSRLMLIRCNDKLLSPITMTLVPCTTLVHCFNANTRRWRNQSNAPQRERILIILESFLIPYATFITS